MKGMKVRVNWKGVFNLVSMLIGLSLVIGSTLTFSGPSIGQGKLGDSSQVFAQSDGSEMVDVIVQYSEMPSQAQVDYAFSLGASAYRSYERLPMRAMRLPARALDALAKSEGVEFISLDNEILSLSHVVHQAVKDQGDYYRNSFLVADYVGVAVIDAAISTPSDVSERSIKQYSFIDGPYTNKDKKIQSVSLPGMLNGMDAASNSQAMGKPNVFSLHVFDGSGKGVISNLIAALDWVLQHGDTLDIQVVNMSLDKRLETAAGDPLNQAIEAVWDAGIVVVDLAS